MKKLTFRDSKMLSTHRWAKSNQMFSNKRSKNWKFENDNYMCQRLQCYKTSLYWRQELVRQNCSSMIPMILPCK